MGTFDGLGIDSEMLNSGLPMNMGNLDGMRDVIAGMPKEVSHDIGGLFDEKLSGTIDFKIWLKIIDLQKEFNDRVSPGWETDINQSKFDTWMAILDETVEVLGSKEWKWWKDTSKLGTIDWNNVHVEFIDIFHFMLSIALQTKFQDSIFLSLMAMEKGAATGRDPFPKQLNDSFFDNFWKEFLMAVWQKSLPLVVVKWVEFYRKAGGNFNTLARDYFIKNALNHIRQEFGYADGRYQKLWISSRDKSKTVEDNVVASELLRKKFTDNVNENSVNEMKTILRKYYLEFVAI